VVAALSSRMQEVLVASLLALGSPRHYGYVPNAMYSAQAEAVLPLLGSSHHTHSRVPSEFDWRNVDGVNYAVADVQQHAPVYCASTCLESTCTVRRLPGRGPLTR